MARHYLRADEQHMIWMSGVVRRLGAPQRTLTAKNRGRLRPLDDPANVRALVLLPPKLMELAQRESLPKRAACLAEMAAAIEILLVAPMRLGNLTRLDIERNLCCAGRAGSILHTVIERAETKNGEPMQYPLPASSTALIERYQYDHRPALAPAGNTAVFPGQHGPRNIEAFGKKIANTVFAQTGLRMNPHLFRHAAAKIFLDRNPGQYGVMKNVLGHRSQQTTMSYYVGCETVAAVRHFDATILAVREGRNE